MNRKIVALTALGITHAAVLLGLLITSQHLPPRVASHFNGAGMPDGWMLRSSYLWSMTGIVFGMTAILVGVFYGIRFFPPSAIILPHRDYWLAPERRQETFEVFFRAGVWLAVFQAAFLLGVHLLVAAANASRPVVLSSQIWLLLVGLLLATIIWAFCLIQKFRWAAKGGEN